MKCVMPGCEKKARYHSNYCSSEHRDAPRQDFTLLDECANPGCEKPAVLDGTYCSEKHKRFGAWPVQQPADYKQGDLRVVTRLSLLPRCIDGCWYWLRPLFVVQRYWLHHDMTPDVSPKVDPKDRLVGSWIKLRWSKEKPDGNFRWVTWSAR